MKKKKKKKNKKGKEGKKKKQKRQEYGSSALTHYFNLGEENPFIFVISIFFLAEKERKYENKIQSNLRIQRGNHHEKKKKKMEEEKKEKRGKREER